MQNFLVSDHSEWEVCETHVVDAHPREVTVAASMHVDSERCRNAAYCFKQYISCIRWKRVEKISIKIFIINLHIS
jgi:hypothetical protein